MNNWKLFNLICSFHPEIEDKRQKLCGARSDLIRICGECFLCFLSPSRLLAPDCGCLQSDEDYNTQHQYLPIQCLAIQLLSRVYFSYLVSYHFLPPLPRRPVSTVHCPDHGSWKPGLIRQSPNLEYSHILSSFQTYKHRHQILYCKTKFDTHYWHCIALGVFYSDVITY